MTASHRVASALPAGTTTAIVSFVLVVALTIPSLDSWRRKITSQYHKIQDEIIYEDKDGSATIESQRAYSDKLQRILLLLGSTIALVFSTTIFVITYLDIEHRCRTHVNACNQTPYPAWLPQAIAVVVWFSIFLQTCIVFRISDFIAKYRLGIYGAVTAVVYFVGIILQALFTRFLDEHSPTTQLYYPWIAVQLGLTLALALVFVSLPRRPDVFVHDRIVDQQYTLSFLGRTTFAFATPLLAKAAKEKRLEYPDLPAISNESRARTLYEQYTKTKSNRFWKTLFWSHKSTFLMQWTLSIFQALSIFVPQVALYFALKFLEERDAGAERKLHLWLLVAALGASNALSSWLETYLWYICYVRLGVTVYAQISAIIFGKAMQRKDIKGVSETSDEILPVESGVVNKGSGPQGEDTAVDEEDEDTDAAKTKQSTINLIGIDGNRLAEFAKYNAILLGSLIKLTLAIVFLVALIGWIPTIVGFATFLAVMPLNFFISAGYMRNQDGLMKARDSKMAVIAEALQGIRQIKFSALEKEWHEKVAGARRKELSYQWKVFCFDTGLISMWILGPAALSAASLTAYVIINKGLDASVAFTTISVFEAIEMALAVIPEMISHFLDSIVSCTRIQEYLDSPDQEQMLQPGESVTFRDASVAWPTKDKGESDDTFKLKNLNISFPVGELSVISGKTGSGKSLLLSAVIGEADVLSGVVTVPRAPPYTARFDHKANKENWCIANAIAYVSQIPWIENASLRDNILFGLPMDNARYKAVLYASTLEKDFQMFEDGDLTDIGANGINLSGGQKWRVSFARALYSRAGILVLDDIFSAVDAHVGKHLFEEALTGDLGRGRTRILVTHHVSLCLPRTKYSVLLESGTATHCGMTEDLRRQGVLKDFLAQDVETQEAAASQGDRQSEPIFDDGGNLQKMLTNQSMRLRRASTASEISPRLNRAKSQAVDDAVKPDQPKKFVEDEAREIGAVKFTVYKEYIEACGGYLFWAFILLVFMAGVLTNLFRSYWLTVWTRSYDTESGPRAFFLQSVHARVTGVESRGSTDTAGKGLTYYLGVYIGITVASYVVGTAKYAIVFLGSLRASTTLFERLSSAIIRAPLRFLDTTPMGRILNRFTADFNMIDSQLCLDSSFTIHSGIQVVAVLAAGALVSPFILLPALVLFVICSWYASRYLMGAREVKRLESTAKSPVFEQLGSVLSGLATIRAFGKAEAYVDRMNERIDTHCAANFQLWLFVRWMSLRVALVGAVLLTVMGALIVAIPRIDAPLAGFALSFSLQLADSISWMLRQYSNVELDMNAIERVVEYASMPTEDQGGRDVPAAWPPKGEVQVKDLVVSYAPGLPPVLRGLNFSVRQNERVGVVGRTGAGKSSLTLALFRFLEAQSGTIHIDGVDISKIKLFDLRSRLAIIPQDPVLFSGTVRDNLDAFDQHADAELRDALVRVQLTTASSSAQSGTATPVQSSDPGNHTGGNKNIFSSLRSKISEGGLNLSQGQRQLLCLARAIVSRPKIMILDEATSSVDMETDALIQRSIREEFADSTLIVIAHRLSTIADFDRILVLGEGKVLEFDSPLALMRRENGVFRGMVEQSGERGELEAIIEGQESR